MSTPTSNRLKGAVAEQAAATGAPSAEVAQRSGPPSIYSLIQAQLPQIQAALPKHMDPDKLARTVVTVIKGNPKLLEATPQSLLGALMLSAQLGLEPGPLGHCYFVPFKNNKAQVTDGRGRTVTTSQMEVQWILGYKGIINLAQRSGQLLSISANAVYSKDFFEFEYGLNEDLRHKPAKGDRGELEWFWMVAKFKDGGHYMRVMSVADVEKHRARSRAKDSGPWVTDYEAMGCKTVIRASQPFLPLSVELMNAMLADEQAHSNVTPDFDSMASVVDVTPAAPEITTGPSTAEAGESMAAAGDDLTAPEGVDGDTGEAAAEPGAEWSTEEPPTLADAWENDPPPPARGSRA